MAQLIGEVLSSVNNTFVRRMRSLKDKKGRRESGLYLADGPHLVGEALKGGADIACLIATPAFLERDTPEQRQVRASDVRLYQVQERVMAAICDTRTPQGVAAAVRIPQEIPPLPEKGLVVLLDGVSDPGNVGTIIRTADAVGAAMVLLWGPCADVYSPKVVRATMGALYHVPVRGALDVQADIALLKARGFRLIGTHLAGDAYQSGRDVFTARNVLVIGSEARGMSELLRDACDALVKLPMPGRAESLNAAVAAGVFLYDWLRAKPHNAGEQIR
nr:RNA methyltransferase [Maliibacterium massiliense]